MQQDLRGWKQRRTVIASILLLLEPLLGISKEESKLGSSKTVKRNYQQQAREEKRITLNMPIKGAGKSNVKTVDYTPVSVKNTA